MQSGIMLYYFENKLCMLTNLMYALKVGFYVGFFLHYHLENVFCSDFLLPTLYHLLLFNTFN